jgi:hypothetical protein
MATFPECPKVKGITDVLPLLRISTNKQHLSISQNKALMALGAEKSFFFFFCFLGHYTLCGFASGEE